MKTFTQKGLTLIELMISIVIGGIVMSIAVPSMSNFVKNDRITSFRNSLHVDLMLARSRAVEQNLEVHVCASTDRATCDGSSFQDGWIVVADTDNSGTITAEDQVLKTQLEIKSKITFSGGLNTITYDSRGFTPDTIGTISVCDERGNEHGKTITISRTGRVSNQADPAC